MFPLHIGSAAFPGELSRRAGRYHRGAVLGTRPRFWMLRGSGVLLLAPGHASNSHVMVNCNQAKYAFPSAPRVSYVELRSIVG